MREEKAVGRGEAGPQALTTSGQEGRPKSYFLTSFPTEKAFASTPAKP